MGEGGSKPGKFVWPPKAISEAEVGPPVDPSYWKKQPAREAVVVSNAPTAKDQTTHSAARPEIRRGGWHPDAQQVDARPCGQGTAWSWHMCRRNIETVWLGMTRATLAERAVEAGWAPDALLDFCWRCGGSVGLHEAGEDGCTDCRGKKMAWSRCVRLGEYHGLLRDVVHEVKFTAWRRLGRDVGRLLGEQLLTALDGVDRSRLVLVPVPSTLRRRLARGIDHTLVIARGVREVTGGRIARALARSHRPSQVGLPMAERRRNVVGTMKLARRLGGWSGLAGCTVVVIDDVRTTGATMTEACRALGRGLKELETPPAAVIAAVLGVATEQARRRGSNKGLGGADGQVLRELPTLHPQNDMV